MFSNHELPIDNHAGSNTRTDGEENKIGKRCTLCAEPEFSESRSLRIIFDMDDGIGTELLIHLADFAVLPLKPGCVHNTSMNGVNNPCDRHSDPFERHHFGFVLERPELRYGCGDKLFR